MHDDIHLNLKLFHKGLSLLDLLFFYFDFFKFFLNDSFIEHKGIALWNIFLVYNNDLIVVKLLIQGFLVFLLLNLSLLFNGMTIALFRIRIFLFYL